MADARYELWNKGNDHYLKLKSDNPFSSNRVILVFEHKGKEFRIAFDRMKKEVYKFKEAWTIDGEKD